MRGFTILWLGQIVSLLGSAMTWFAFTIWAWKTTGSITALSIVSFSAFLPTVLFAPLAGTFVDRWNRKLVMMLSDAATAIGTLVVLILYATDNLQIWHIYIVSILAGFFTAFQYPAYTAAMTTMLPKNQYARASGMLGLAVALSGILAPVFAAALLGPIGMTGIMIIDLVTFLAAFGTLLWIDVPQPTIISRHWSNINRAVDLEQDGGQRVNFGNCSIGGSNRRHSRRRAFESMGRTATSDSWSFVRRDRCMSVGHPLAGTGPCNFILVDRKFFLLFL